ncbi:MAG: hypothetical protein AAGK32_06115, partial [Actinomycetota bacterium]
AARELAERHAPVLFIRSPSEPCLDDGERFLPLDVEALLDNDQVLLRQVGRNDPVVERGPTAADLFDHGEGFYLDFPGGALAPGCIYERDVIRYQAAAEPSTDPSTAGPARSVAYAHIATQPDAGDQLALQYWFFYYYNDYNNRHEGDWEGIQLLFDVGTIEEALETAPVSVGYAQHVGGERASWEGSKLQREGARPVVYPSVGSHASYFGTNLYMGRSGSEGFGCDDTQDATTRVDLDVVLLPDEVDDPLDPLAWLDFDGRWGERHSGPFNGPKGPTTKARWTTPIDWHEEIRTSSVVIPGGTESATPLLNTFCSVVAFGSTQYINAQQQPLRLAATVVAAVAAVAVVATRTSWAAVAATPIVRRRCIGEILGVAGRSYRRHPARFIEIGLIYMPVAVLFALTSEVIGRLTPTDSENALLAVVALLAAIAAALGQSLAYVLITAVFAAVWMGADDGERVSGIEGYRRMARRSGDLALGYARALLIIVGLALTLIGLPWAIRQLVRYQFFGQVIMVEDRRGGEALRRSSELVRGRWLHTAVAGLTLTGLVSLANVVVGLVLLLVLSGLPLWLFLLAASAASALVVPVSAVGNVLLYGDARAEAEGAPPAGPADAEVDPLGAAPADVTTTATMPPAS